MAMKPPEWKTVYQVVTVTSDEEFQWALNDATLHNYVLVSWRNLFNSDVGYGITAVFRTQG